MEECRNSNSCFSLAMIDVNSFKRVNDIYGHTEGDRVLLNLAHILNINSNISFLPVSDCKTF